MMSLQLCPNTTILFFLIGNLFISKHHHANRVAARQYLHSIVPRLPAAASG